MLPEYSKCFGGLQGCSSALSRWLVEKELPTCLSFVITRMCRRIRKHAGGYRDGGEGVWKGQDALIIYTLVFAVDLVLFCIRCSEGSC